MSWQTAYKHTGRIFAA